jgi:hypothetical protein
MKTNLMWRNGVFVQKRLLKQFWEGLWDVSYYIGNWNDTPLKCALPKSFKIDSQKRYQPENWFGDRFDDSRRFRLLELVNEWVDVLDGRLKQKNLILSDWNI